MVRSYFSGETEGHVRAVRRVSYSSRVRSPCKVQGAHRWEPTQSLSPAVTVGLVGLISQLQHHTCVPTALTSRRTRGDATLQLTHYLLLSHSGSLPHFPGGVSWNQPPNHVHSLVSELGSGKTKLRKHLF